MKSSKLLQTELAIVTNIIVMHGDIMFMAPASYSEGPESNHGPEICCLDKFFVKKLSSGM